MPGFLIGYGRGLEPIGINVQWTFMFSLLGRENDLSLFEQLVRVLSPRHKISQITLLKARP